MKTKSTKRALLMSGLSLLLCFSMLVGSTFAWFTDSVTSANNKIQAGTLQIDLELLDKTSGDWNSIKANKDPLFNYSLWEPGYTQAVVLKVQNEGTLALKWMAKFVSTYELTALADVIDVYVKEGATTYPADRDLTGYTKVGTVRDFVNTIETTTVGTLMPVGQTGSEATLGLILKMQETAGNAYQGLDLGGAFDIQIMATQLTYESDSFGKEYDANATLPVSSLAVAIPEVPTEPLTLKTPDAEVAVPAEVAEELYDAGVKSLSLKHSEPVAGNGVVNFDFLELVDQDGNIVDLEAMGNQDPITVVLPTDEANGTNVEVYHDNECVAVATVANDVITYTANHFCQVSVKAIDGQGVYGGIDWVLYKDGTLRIAPTKGEPAPDKNAPTKRTYEVGEWRENVVYKSNGSASAIGGQPYDAKKVKSLIIEEGVTTIGSFAVQFPNLTGEVVIPSTVTYIGQEAFKDTKITKLTFAKGGTAPLCIANGAFKKILIEEVSFPGDREYIHIHHWVFQGASNLKHAYIPANVTKVWGGEHVDYFDNFNSQTNVTWEFYGSIFTGCTKMETITFENEAARGLFYTNKVNSSKEDYIVACVGLTAYNSVEAAIAVAQPGDTIILVRDVEETAVIPTGVNFEKGIFTAPNVTVQ